MRQDRDGLPVYGLWQQNPQTHNLSVFGRRYGCKARSRTVQPLMFSKGPVVPCWAHYGDAGISGESPEFNNQAPAGDEGRNRARG